MSEAGSERVLRVVELGRMAYGPALELQEGLVEKRQAGEIPDVLLLLEHDPVYTLGRNADESHILLSQEALQARGIEVYPTSRGGDVTYHGPGQLVGYPILELGKESRKVVWYVSRLEEVVIRTLSRFGVEAETDRRNRGVWVGDKKVAALGVRITGGVTMHGFALNVHPSLADYAGIVPCGIADKGVTSLHRLCPEAAMPAVMKAVTEMFATVFEYKDVRDVDPEEVSQWLGR